MARRIDRTPGLSSKLLVNISCRILMWSITYLLLVFTLWLAQNTSPFSQAAAIVFAIFAVFVVFIVTVATFYVDFEPDWRRICRRVRNAWRASRR